MKPTPLGHANRLETVPEGRHADAGALGVAVVGTRFPSEDLETAAG